MRADHLRRAAIRPRAPLRGATGSAAPTAPLHLAGVFHPGHARRPRRRRPRPTRHHPPPAELPPPVATPPARGRLPGTDGLAWRGCGWSCVPTVRPVVWGCARRRPRSPRSGRNFSPSNKPRGHSLHQPAGGLSGGVHPRLTGWIAASAGLHGGSTASARASASRPRSPDGTGARPRSPRRCSRRSESPGRCTSCSGTIDEARVRAPDSALDAEWARWSTPTSPPRMSTPPASGSASCSAPRASASALRATRRVAFRRAEAAVPTPRGGKPDSPPRNGGLTAPKRRTHRGEMRDSPSRNGRLAGSGAEYGRADLVGVRWRNADLRRAGLRGALLLGADLARRGSAAGGPPRSRPPWCQTCAAPTSRPACSSRPCSRGRPRRHRHPLPARVPRPAHWSETERP
jgi:hypothetical protein